MPDEDRPGLAVDRPALSEIVGRHLGVCARFSDVVAVAHGRWDHPSPCAGWDARAVVGHVIGFHDVLVLAPFGRRPARRGTGPGSRWEATAAAVEATLRHIERGPVEAHERSAASALVRLLPAITTDVLVHTWDLARAVGTAAALDPAACTIACEGVRRHAAEVRASGMFAPPVPVPDTAGVEDRLVALLGRQPRWEPPASSASPLS
jgi:uncharacterized protein (TIGR03086 family)